MAQETLVNGLRSFAKGSVWPAFRPVWRMMWARIEARLEPVQARLDRIEQRLASAGAATASAHVESRLAALDAAWRLHVPEFLNAVGTVSAFAHELQRFKATAETQLNDHGARIDATSAGMRAIEDRIAAEASRAATADAALDAGMRGIADRLDQAVGRLDAADTAIRDFGERFHNAGIRLDNGDSSIRGIWDRMEFVRRELLFEMAHGAGRQASIDAERAIVARIVATDKVAAARAKGAIRLNLGCGHIALPDHVNVDQRELPGVDVVADAGDLPFEPGSIDEIFSSHLLEHFPQEAMRRRLLPYWHGLLRPGGMFRAVTPDAAAMLAAAGTGAYAFEDFREGVFGAQDYVGDYHLNLFTPESLGDLLAAAGFTEIRIPVAGRRNGKCFEFEITGLRA